MWQRTLVLVVLLVPCSAFAADEMNTKTTAVFTESGLMARRLSALRPNQQIVALTPSADVRNSLALVWGVNPLRHGAADSAEEILKFGEKTLLEAGAVAHWPRAVEGVTAVRLAPTATGAAVAGKAPEAPAPAPTMPASRPVPVFPVSIEIQAVCGTRSKMT